jgi:hypothetical protein
VQQFGGATTNMFEISDSDSDNRNGDLRQLLEVAILFQQRSLERKAENGFA